MKYELLPRDVVYWLLLLICGVMAYASIYREPNAAGDRHSWATLQKLDGYRIKFEGWTSFIPESMAIPPEEQQWERERHKDWPPQEVVAKLADKLSEEERQAQWYWRMETEGQWICRPICHPFDREYAVTRDLFVHPIKRKPTEAAK